MPKITWDATSVHKFLQQTAGQLEQLASTSTGEFEQVLNWRELSSPDDRPADCRRPGLSAPAVLEDVYNIFEWESLPLFPRAYLPLVHPLLVELGELWTEVDGLDQILPYTTSEQLADSGWLDVTPLTREEAEKELSIWLGRLTELIRRLQAAAHEILHAVDERGTPRFALMLKT